MRQTAILLPSLLLLVAPAIAAPQDEGRDPAKAVESYERYLARKPYHDWAFEKLVEAAVAVNELGQLVERYEARVAEDPGALPPRVVLARLFAQTDRVDEALEVLGEVEEEDAHLLRLAGTLQLRVGRWDAAVAALDRAATSTDDPELLEEIHRQRGQAYLASGDRDAAVGAFRDLAAIDPGSFHLRLEAASELAWHGLAEEALEELAAADELAGDDTSKRCRVLSEIGRLHERLTQGEQAVAVYRRAIGLMARGNWLKRDLYDRILAIHQRSGTLEALVAAARADVEASAADLDARELLASTLLAAGRPEEARDVLFAAIAEFPADLALSRRLLEVLEGLGDDEGRIAEYQRVLAHRPEELELYLELGRVLASSGRFEAAREQWNRTLETRLQDAGLCVRLAGFYALYDQTDDAVAMYEKAIALEPGEMRHYADLAAFLAVRDRADEVSRLLEGAEAAAAGHAGRLGELASLWSEYGQPARARAALEAALAVAGEDAQLLSRLADALALEGEVERAAEVLHQVLASASETGLRNSAVDRILRLFRREDRLEELVAREELAIAEDPTAVAPRLVLAKLFVQRREPELAIDAYRGLLEVAPDEEGARRALARLYEDEGDYAASLAQYEALLAARPQARRSSLKEIARIHLARLDQERAFECYEEILRGAPDNAAAFEEVAEAYDRLGLHDRRLECLQQAVRLEPENADYRLDLSDAWRIRGEWDNARKEIEAAIRAARDDDVREDARERLYVLLSETGQLEAEVESLRRRVEENPYDDEAPLTLTDFYVRELEYELALEMLDRLLTFQPREPRLLEERARLYRLMERHAEAIADYETLWKLPESDRGALALDLAEASLESGDLERAAKVLAGVSDAREVASLYRRHDLPDEAIAVLQKAIAGAPGDDRMLFVLARLQEEIGDREGAVATLQQLLALRGDSWRVLLKLGELHHDMGDDGEARDVGARLFSLLRVDDPVEDPDEEENERKDPWAAANSYRRFNASQQLSERVRAVRGFFEGEGRLDDFIALGSAELQAQPTNDALYSQVLYALRSAGQREDEARALVCAVRDATEASGRVPAGTTHEAWRLRLDRDEANLYSNNSTFARERAGELAARIAAGGATARDHRELAQLHGTLQQDADEFAALEAGVAAFPDSVALQAGLAMTLDENKRFAHAADAYARLVEMLETSGWRELESERLEHSFKARKQQLLQQFPVHVQRRVNDEVLRRVFDMTGGPSTSLEWTLGNDPSLDGARMRLARCLIKLDRTDEAKAALVALEPENPEDVRRWSGLASLYYDEQLFDEAEAVFRRLRDLDAALLADPLLGHSRAWSSTVRGAMRSFGRLLEKRGELLAAYDLLRTYGYAEEGELLLTTNGLVADAEARYARERQAAADTLAGGDESALEAWREASIKLADVLQIRKRWDDVMAVYEELAERLEDDFGVLQHIAALHARAGRVEDTVATYYRIIERKRELNRRMRREEAPDARRIFPTPPQGDGSGSNDGLAGLGYLGSASFSTSRANPYAPQRGRGGLYGLREDYLAILRLHLDRRQTEEAAEVLRRIAREDAASFRWMSWEVRELIENYQLGAEGLPILRLMHSYDPDDEYAALNYGRALVQASRLEEAHKVLTRVANKGRRSWWTTSEAREELDGLEARMGLAAKKTLEDLRAAALAEPKNVKTRIDLARRLAKERLFEEALEQGRAAEQLAPHLDEVADFVTEMLQVLDRRAELEQRLRERLATETDSAERFSIAVRLADWMRERGESADAIDALFEEVVEYRYGGAVVYAPSSWYLEKGDLDAARARLESEIERTGENAPSAAGARQRLATIALLEGDPTAGLDEAWRRFEKATARGARATALGQMAGVLRGLPDMRASRDDVETLAKGYGGGMRGELTRAAWLLAAGETRELEGVLDGLSQEGEEYLFLYPVLVDLARQRGDLHAALGYLRRLEGTNHPSRTRTVDAGDLRLTEYQALRAEIGSLLFETGDPEGARELWSTLYAEEERDEGRSTLASLYEMHDLHADAARLLREEIDEEGEKSAAMLNRLADLERELGDHEEARALLEKALILSGHSAEQRMRLASMHRDRGTLPRYLDELVAQAEADPDDAGVARLVVQLAVELGRDDVALRTVERLSDRPEQAQTLKPLLLRMRLLRGEEAAALELYADILAGNVEEYWRQRYGLQLALALGRRGEVERAVAVLEKAAGDADSKEAKAQLAHLYRELERFEEALAETDAELELAPTDAEATARRIALLRELGREREALDACYDALEDPAFTHGRDAFRGELPALVAKFDEEARLTAELERAPGDLALSYRLALVLATQRRWAEAAPLLETVLASDAAHHGALHELWPCYRALDRFEDAERTILALVAILDREQVLEAEYWPAQNTIQRLQQSLGELHLLDGDREGALDAWRREIGRRNRQVNAHTYSYSNSPLAHLDARNRWLEAHGFHREYLDGMGLYARFQNWNQEYYEARTFTARYRAGDRERALEDAWDAVAEPGRGLVVDAGSDGTVWYSSSGEQVDSRWQTLGSLWREAGRFDELVGRVRAELEISPEDEVMQELLLHLLAADERWEEVAEIHRAALAEDPDDRAREDALSVALIELGRYEEALPLVERVYRARISEIPDAGGRMMSSERGSRRGTPGKVRFQWSGGSTSTSQRSYYYYGSGAVQLEVSGEETAARRRLMTLYARLGAADRARELEGVELAMAMMKSWGAEGVPLELARAYADAGLLDDAERLALMAIEQSDELVDAACQAMVQDSRENDDAERQRSWALRWHDHLTEQIAEDPHAAAPLQQRAWLRLEELDDPEGAAEDVAALLARDPRDAAALRMRGWLELERGESGKAVGSFRESERLSLALGMHVGADLHYGLGFALAAVEGPETARPVLRRALAADGDGRHAPRAEELLE